MATTAELRVVNLAGLVQGIVLVTFPAASTVFTDPAGYDLTSTQYGAMFLRRWPPPSSRRSSAPVSSVVSAASRSCSSASRRTSSPC